MLKAYKRTMAETVHLFTARNLLQLRKIDFELREMHLELHEMHLELHEVNLELCEVKSVR